jgi:predicted ester cyclase
MKSRTVFLLLLLPLVTLSLNCAGELAREKRNKEIVMRAFEILNGHMYDGLDQVIARDYRRYCQATPEVKVESLDDFRELLQEWDRQIPDARVEIDVLIAEGNLVAFYGTFSGTQTGPMGPFPATGKQMDSEFSGYHRIDRGKIVETWVTWDNMTILTQLGHFPPPAAGALEGEEE